MSISQEEQQIPNSDLNICESQRAVYHRMYLRYRFGCQDAKAPGGVLRWVELSAAEVELIRQRGGEDHSNHVQVISLIQRSITVPQTLGDLKGIAKR